MRFFSILSYAAGPITHVMLGEQWLAKHAPEYTEEQRKLFLLGTVFPDIRYLGTIEREKTHYVKVSLDQVLKEPSAFQRGVLFHSYVDEFREKWIRKYKIENKIKNMDEYRKGTFLKLIEDQILYTRGSWGKFRQFLLSIPEEEKTYGINDKTLTEWHTGLSLYFAASPELLLSQLSMLEKDIMNVKASEIKQWANLLPQYVNQDEMKSHVDKMIAAFQHAINA